MIDIRQETPIASFSILAYLCWRSGDTGRYLVLKRSSSYLMGTWQPISGRIEKDETAWEAALREIKEEAGLTPDRFYSTNQVESFYAVDQNCINLVPVFVGSIDAPQPVGLSPEEHSEYRWITVAEADDYLSFTQQRNLMEYIEREFVQEPPREVLRIQFQDSEHATSSEGGLDGGE